MIDSRKINEKFKSLNDRIDEIGNKFGEETAQELITRIEASLKSFLGEFKELSSESFDFYWKKQEKLNFKNGDKIDNELDDKNVPKFISDYNRNDNKK